jgi:hypothetical protein
MTKYLSLAILATVFIATLTSFCWAATVLPPPVATPRPVEPRSLVVLPAHVSTPQPVLQSSPVRTRSEIDRQLTLHKASLENYVLTELDRIALLAETDGSQALKEAKLFISALEDQSGTELAIIKKTLDYLLPYPKQSQTTQFPHITKLIQDLMDGELEASSDKAKTVDVINEGHRLLIQKASMQASNQARVMTLTDLTSITTTDVTSSFNALDVGNFMQSIGGSACVLYSFLWGIHENPVLKAAFISNVLNKIKKDSTGNYYLLGNHNTVSKFTPIDLRSASKDMHPGNSLLTVIGFYVLGEMNLSNPSFYYLSSNSTGRDYFFNQPTIVVGKKYVVEKHVDPSKPFNMEDGMTVFKQNGTLLFQEGGKEKIISGNFVVSVATPGHAISIYYEDIARKWMVFDNVQGLFEMPKELPRGVNGFQIIGIFRVADKV